VVPICHDQVDRLIHDGLDVLWIQAIDGKLRESQRFESVVPDLRLRRGPDALP
jgi:hypothetical protein